MPPPFFLTLGQGFSQIPDPDPLPPAPFFERYFLESPIPTVIFLALVALIGWWLLQRAGRARDSWILVAACAAIAGGSVLLAGLVVTQREALVLRAADLVNATIDAKADAVAPFLREDVTVSVLGDDRPNLDRRALLDRIEKDRMTRTYVKDAHLRWVTATLDGPNAARTQCRVSANTPLGDSTPTTWMLHWSRRDEHSPWQVRTIEGQQIGLMPLHSLGGF